MTSGPARYQLLDAMRGVAALAVVWADACDIAKYLRRWGLRRGVALRGVRANDVAVTGQYRPPGLSGQTQRRRAVYKETLRLARNVL